MTKRVRTIHARTLYHTFLVVAAAFISQGLVPASVQAFQSHPAPEGLYAHQLAHFFFLVAMVFLAYWLEVNQLILQRGWRLIQVACVLFVLWNLAALSGHWVEERVPREVLQGDPDWTQRIDLTSHGLTQAYYVLKLDHLVCVPAMVCLFLGMRALYRDVAGKEPSADA
jgi:hypothetical protein